MKTRYQEASEFWGIRLRLTGPLIMKFFLGVLVVLLLILHQDNWYWTDGTLVEGFMPIGLLYHVGISLAAAFVWFLTTIFLWPQEVERDQRATAHNDSSTGAN